MLSSSDMCMEGNSRKRGRLRQACNSCSRVKKKCDGGNPCSFCEKGNLACIYEERIKPGPPPKKSQKGTDTHQNFQGSTPAHHSLKALKNESPIHADELNFITIYMQNVQGNIPLMSQAIINDGISKIAQFSIESNTSVGYSATDSEAIVSLTWSACCFGAFLAQDNRSESYLMNSHKSLQRCLQGSSLLVAKAFFAIEVLLQLLSESQSTFFLLSRKGVFLGLGEAILFLSSTPKDVDCEIVWNLLRFWKTPNNLIGATSFEFWNTRYPTISIGMNDNYVKHSHVLLHFWTSRLSEDNYSDLIIMNNSNNSSGVGVVGHSNINNHSSSSSSSESNRNLIESYVNGIVQDIRHIKLLEDTCLIQDTNPPTTVILHFSLSMHRLKLNQFEKAFHGLKSVAAYFWMRPFIISTLQMWKVVYITRMVLLNSELTPVIMQSSLRPLADDLLALLCHTGKLFGFNDIYVSNSSPILANIRKNVMNMMFPASSNISDSLNIYSIPAAGNNLVTVLTMNGWLRLVEGEVVQHDSTLLNINNHHNNLNLNNSSNNINNLNTINLSSSQPSKLSSMTVPSNFIDKRTSVPERSISAAIESRVMAAAGSVSSGSSLNQRNSSRRSDINSNHHNISSLSHDRYSSSNTTGTNNMDAMAGGKVHSNASTSSGDHDNEDNHKDTRRSSRNYRSITTKIKDRTVVTRGQTQAQAQSQYRISEISTEILPSSGSAIPRNNSMTSGVDELLLHMMNADYGMDYSSEGIPRMSSLASLSESIQSPRPPSATQQLQNQINQYNQINQINQNDQSKLSNASVPVQYLDSRLNSINPSEQLAIPRISSEISMSVMDNLETWMTDLDPNVTYA